MRIDDEEIELTEEKAKRILIGCGILTEDGEIVEAYRDIIVKKEAKNNEGIYGRSR